MHSFKTRLDPWCARLLAIVAAAPLIHCGGTSTGGEDSGGASSGANGGTAGKKGSGGATGSGATGSGVQTFTGAFSFSRSVLSIPGRGPSPTLTLAYNSNDTRVGPLGPGWTTNYHIRVRNDGSGNALLVGAQGRSDRYTAPSWTLSSPGVSRASSTFPAVRRAWRAIWRSSA